MRISNKTLDRDKSVRISFLTFRGTNGAIQGQRPPAPGHGTEIFERECRLTGIAKRSVGATREERIVRRESHHPTSAAVRGGSIPARSASAAFPTCGSAPAARAAASRIGVLPGPLPQAARGRSTQLRIVRRGAPASPSRPSRLPSHQVEPAGKAGVKEENR